MDIMEKFRILLTRCRSILNRGYTKEGACEISWLNNFCAEFLEFTSHLQKYLTNVDDDNDQRVETILLCLSQIVICVKHMEKTLKAEEASGVISSASRQHFLDRLHWCLERLRVSLRSLASHPATKKSAEEYNFVELMDMTLNYLSPYCSYKEINISKLYQKKQVVLDSTSTSKQLRCVIDQILTQTLAFANVALQEDKIALSALCQKVLRECIAFQDECSTTSEHVHEVTRNDCSRRVKAISLENSLCQLEDYINESLLRLIYSTFSDHIKFSIENVRNVMRLHGADHPVLDEFIADFDVNLDRTTQIGIFAIAFAPNNKIKTALRSCLASLESLDAYIIPALQTSSASDIHTEILEQHFNEEIAKFNYIIQEIIDTRAFVASYYGIITQTLNSVEKSFDKLKLRESLQMGEFLYEHFQLKVNREELETGHQSRQRLQLFEKFKLILHECQAVLACADQVDHQRILKRFKILRSIVRKFSEALGSVTNTSTIEQEKGMEENVFINSSEDLSNSHSVLESIGISATIPSILYCNEFSQTRRRRRSNYALKENYAHMSRDNFAIKLLSQNEPQRQNQQRLQISPMIIGKRRRLLAEAQAKRMLPAESLRRKQSLRTSMFKRYHQQINESQQNMDGTNLSISLHVTDILNQLSTISSNASNALQSIRKVNISTK